MYATRLMVRLPVFVLAKRTAILCRVTSAACLVRLSTAVPAALQSTKNKTKNKEKNKHEKKNLVGGEFIFICPNGYLF